MKKNNAWNIRRLVNESFVPSTQRASVFTLLFYQIEPANYILKIVGFQDGLGFFGTVKSRPVHIMKFAHCAASAVKSSDNDAGEVHSRTTCPSQLLRV